MPTSRIGTALALTCAALASGAAPVQALNILLTNDDGFEAASLHAMYQRLKASGHSVIIAAPALDATAQGGGVVIGRAIESLPTATRGGAVRARSPGIGTLPTDQDVHYVNGTPVMSVLYGLDLLAKPKWGKSPDLVVSGINYGLNVGRAWSGSGTVNAAIAAIARGVPAIAVSADFPLASYQPVSQLKTGSREYELADFVVNLVKAVEQSRPAPDAPLLPRLLGLNVNLPAFAAGKAASLPVKLTHTGTANNAMPVFVSNLARDWPGVPLLPRGPGIALLGAGQLPVDVPRLVDDDPYSEYNVVKQGGVAVSVVEAALHVAPLSPDAFGAQILTNLAVARATSSAPAAPTTTPTPPTSLPASAPSAPSAAPAAPTSASAPATAPGAAATAAP